MKKMLLASALFLILGCAQRAFTVQNKPAAVAPKGNHHPSFFLFWGGQRKLSMQPKFVAAQKIIVKTEASKHSLNVWLLGLLLLGIYTPLEARVYCSQ